MATGKIVTMEAGRSVEDGRLVFRGEDGKLYPCPVSGGQVTPAIMKVADDQFRPFLLIDAPGRSPYFETGNDTFASEREAIEEALEMARVWRESLTE